MGGVALAWFALGFFEQALNWASVSTLLLVPVSFGVGARFERLRPPAARLAGVVLLIGLLLVTAISIGSAATGGAATSFQWTDTTHGYDMIAPWWQDPASGQPVDFPSGISGWSAPGVEEVRVEAANAVVIGRFSDFRLGAWQAESARDGWRLVPGQRGPFATATAAVVGTTVSGTLRFNQAPGVDGAESNVRRDRSSSPRSRSALSRGRSR